jgi:ribonuclease BN (tRNA processing enzyme)
MRVRILASAPGGRPEQYLTTLVVENKIAIDAGSLGLHAVSANGDIEHIFITHAHVDHVGTLPLFLEAWRDRGNGPARIHGSAATLTDVREHLFNEGIWLGYSQLQSHADWVELLPVEAERPVSVGNLRITGVPVDHTVPTMGYIVENGSSAFVFGADSGPTERLWEVARATPGMRAALLECSFPNRLRELADKTGHLTPELWALELKKLPANLAILAVHIKPRYRDEVLAELAALGDRRVQVAEMGQEYVF